MKRCVAWGFVVGCMLLMSALGVAAGSWPAVSELKATRELPDPLVMFDGRPVTTKKDWIKQRKPELRELFQHYMYGHFPGAAKVKAKLEYTDRSMYGGRATLKLLTLSYGPVGTSPIHLMVVVPNERKGPAPVFVGMNFCGNHALVTNTHVPVTMAAVNSKYPGVVNNHATEAGRGKLLDMWAIEQTVRRGYAVATFNRGDVEPDEPGATNGVRAAYRKVGEQDWGTIAAWAWGLQRIVDYIEKDRELDSKRIAAVGHSRLGKTALLAGAFDERIALIIPLQAGCGGTAPSRGKVGESVKKINQSFPHWFCEEFKKFGEAPERLPFDQHCLIAMCAPRPVLLANATEDTWANPEGQFEMLKAADKVYRLMGAEGVGVQTMPEVGKLVDSTLGYFIRPGKHSMTEEDWKAFLDFADKHFGK